MYKLFSAVMSLGIASIIALSGDSTVLAQGKPTEGEILTRTLTLEKPGVSPVKIKLMGTAQRITNATGIAAILYENGVSADGVKIATTLILAGAAPESVADLSFAMAGMLPQGGQLDINRFNLALTAYNAIIDKADAATIQSLQKTPEFMDIGELLKAIREPIG